jgi:formylglycine-generating enzyme required for sulfatase activity
VETLRAAGVDVWEDRLLDLLWLARILPAGDPVEPPRPRERVLEGPRPAPPEPPEPPPPSVREESIEVILRREEYESGEVYAEGAERDGGEIRVTRQRVAGVPALPQAGRLGRSLRPLARTRLRGVGVVDEAATVDRIADSGLVLPVIRPGREKLFDVVVVLDDRSSMIVWRQTAIELTRLFDRLGTFRNASLLRLTANQQSGELTLRGWKRGDWRGEQWDDRPTEAAPVEAGGRTIDSLLDPEGHRIVFLLSDGVAETWRDGRMSRVLARWGRTMPVVLLQVLGEERWHRTMHGEPRARVKAPEPGAPNRRLTLSLQAGTPGAMALPVIMPYPRSMERWAKMLMSGEGDTRALILDPAAGPATRPAGADPNRPPPPPPPIPPIEERFSWLSATAQKLACFLATVPLHPGVMRLVQQVMLPDSRVEHLAEVMLSGLIHRPQANQELFDFVDERETRRWLVDQLRYGELLAVIDRVSSYVSERLGRRLDLVALLRDPAGDLGVPVAALPFARLAQQALEAHGIRPRRATGRIIEERSEGRVTLHPFSFTTVTLDEQGRESRRQTGQAWQFAQPLAEGVSLEMVRIEGGRFAMGSPPLEKDRMENEGPVREVTVPDFYIGKYAVTQAQWRVVAGWEKIEIDLSPEPSYFPKGKRGRVVEDDLRPVEQVNWHQAREFCARLTRRTGRVYRLPSESEWEYACRAGTTTPFAFGPTVTPDIVNYDGNYPYGKAPKGRYRAETIPVGSLGLANPWGLFDMHGNVWEWCEDHAGGYQEAPNDGRPLIREGADDQARRLRGGSWFNSSFSCRSARRYGYQPGFSRDDIGLRVVVGARTRYP